MSEIEDLVEKYNQMVKTGKYNEDDLAAVKQLIDDIYDKYDNNAFDSQDEIDELATQLRIAEDAVRRIPAETDTKKKDTKKRTSRRTSPATGDNASLIVMTVILISALGLAVVSLKKKRENI